LAWAKRCPTPYPEADVLKTLSALVNKSVGKGEYKPPEEGEDEPPLPERPALSEMAYCGLLGEYVRLIEPHTEADPAAILIGTLTAFGNVIGRGPHFCMEPDRHHANLWCVCVGQSGHSRKGVSLGRALDIFDESYRTPTAGACGGR
jgi:hypothetical protein